MTTVKIGKGRGWETGEGGGSEMKKGTEGV